MTKFRNGNRVAYIGDQASLKNLNGTVERDSVAANGTILVRFDGKDRGTVVKPANLKLIAATTTRIRNTDKVLASVTANNPKDAAVLLYGQTSTGLSDAKKARDLAKKQLCNLGLISDAELTPGSRTVYESNAVRLNAETSEPGSQITEASLRAALIKAGYVGLSIDYVISHATVAKKAATTYKVVVK